jgi:hypothetical protein
MAKAKVKAKEPVKKDEVIPSPTTTKARIKTPRARKPNPIAVLPPELEEIERLKAEYDSKLAGMKDKIKKEHTEHVKAAKELEDKYKKLFGEVLGLKKARKKRGPNKKKPTQEGL